MYKVKICGICELGALNAAVASGSDYVGFVFFRKSKRNLTIKKARELSINTPQRVLKVALMVDPEDSDLKRVLEKVPIDILQLHGTESPSRVYNIKRNTGLSVMKAIGVSTKSDLERVDEYARVADQILLDAKPPIGSAVPGGLGKSFDWGILKGVKLSKPWFLAGGLNSKNLKDAIKFTGATKFDVSSGVEDAFGKKTEKKISEFINILKGERNVK